MRFASVFVAVSVLLGGCGLGGGDDDLQVVAYFTDVGDLVEQGQVQINDVEVGRVTDIAFRLHDGDMQARVSIILDGSVRLPATDLEAVIRQTSLLGEAFVELVPTATGAPYVGTRVTEIPVDRTERRVDVESFLAELSGFVGGGGLEDLNRFTHAQAVILEDRGRRFGRTLAELERFTGVLANRRLDIGVAIDHLASAGSTLVQNKATLDSFLDSLDEANVVLAAEGEDLKRLFLSLRRFGTVSARFLSRHENAIGRQFKALRPLLDGLAGAEDELRTDITQLRTFFELFPKSMGGGPGDRGRGDYIQAEAVICEVFESCQTKGEKGDVPGEGP